ncbi:MAG: hypothetical protein INR73_22560 [Williamsia sp.]|nr:hypothetical protein [Williamsia sp.]
MKLFRWVLVLCLLLVAWYLIWSYTGKDYSSLRRPPVSIDTTSSGLNGGKGNMVGIQPFFSPVDYCDQQHFHDALYPYFKKAQAAGWLQPNTLVVLPENVGSGLVFAQEKSRIYGADSMQQAVATVVNSNIFYFIRYLLFTPANDKIKHALVYMKVPTMMHIYTAVFSSLAKEFGVIIAAGSLVLPQPSIDSRGRIRVKRGALYYSAFLFMPDGKIAARPVLKRLPGYSRQEDAVAADTLARLVVPTAAGTVAITAQGNNTLSPSRSKEVKAAVYLNGSDKIWDAAWKVGNSFGIPAEAIRKGEDKSSLQQFLINSLNAPKPTAPLKGFKISDGYAGQLWEIPYENKLLVLQSDSLLAHAPVKGQGKIVNLWFR